MNESCKGTAGIPEDHDDQLGTCSSSAVCSYVGVLVHDL